MKRRDQRRSAFRTALLVLAAVALMFRIAAPPGTMVARTDHGAALVICTGHGPMMGMAAPATSGEAPASKGSKTGDNGVCEFAAHAGNGLVAATLEPARSLAWIATPTPQPVVLETTGSGLAAPPPPSHAPPVLSA